MDCLFLFMDLFCVLVKDLVFVYVVYYGLFMIIYGRDLEWRIVLVEKNFDGVMY